MLQCLLSYTEISVEMLFVSQMSFCHYIACITPCQLVLEKETLTLFLSMLFSVSRRILL